MILLWKLLFFFFSDQSVYQGEWRKSKRHGQGTMRYSNGAQYNGEWRNDKKHGKGLYQYPDGKLPPFKR
jgi:hypothetical protein